jgi:hypothetical protein
VIDPVGAGRVGHAEDACRSHAGCADQDALNLGRVDVEAAADDELFAAADDRDEATLDDLGHISGAAPAVDDGFPTGVDDLGRSDTGG